MINTGSSIFNDFVTLRMATKGFQAATGTPGRPCWGRPPVFRRVRVRSLCWRTPVWGEEWWRRPEYILVAVLCDWLRGMSCLPRNCVIPLRICRFWCFLKWSWRCSSLFSVLFSERCSYRFRDLDMITHLMIAPALLRTFWFNSWNNSAPCWILV